MCWVKWISLLLLAATAGCTPFASATPDYVWADHHAAGLAIEAMTEDTTPDPKPSPYKCATCKDTGRVVHGDGHSTVCPDCSGGASPPGEIMPTGMISDTKELIAKAKPLLAWAIDVKEKLDRQGKIRVDILLPDGIPTMSTSPAATPIARRRGRSTYPSRSSCGSSGCTLAQPAATVPKQMPPPMIGTKEHVRASCSSCSTYRSYGRRGLFRGRWR